MRRDAYDISKREAEDSLACIAAQTGLNGTVLVIAYSKRGFNILYDRWALSQSIRRGYLF